MSLLYRATFLGCLHFGSLSPYPFEYVATFPDFTFCHARFTVPARSYSRRKSPPGIAKKCASRRADAQAALTDLRLSSKCLDCLAKKRRPGPDFTQLLRPYDPPPPGKTLSLQAASSTHHSKMSFAIFKREYFSSTSSEFLVEFFTQQLSRIDYNVLCPKDLVTFVKISEIM